MLGNALAGRKPRQRFSLLLLDDGDHYITDWVATCAFHDGSRQQLRGGRLRLCFKTLFFEPKEMQWPIFMLPLQHVLHFIYPASGESYVANNSAAVNQQSWWMEATRSWSSNDQNLLLLSCWQYVTMKENGEDAPYSFVKKEMEDGEAPALWVLQLDYASTSMVGPTQREGPRELTAIGSGSGAHAQNIQGLVLSR